VGGRIIAAVAEDQDGYGNQGHEHQDPHEDGDRDDVLPSIPRRAFVLWWLRQ